MLQNMASKGGWATGDQVVYEAAGRTGLAAPGQLHRAGGQDNLGENIRQSTVLSFPLPR